jgi:hypothetical protein
MPVEHQQEPKLLTALRYIAALALGVAAEWVSSLLSFLGHAVRTCFGELRSALSVEFGWLPSREHPLTEFAFQDIGLAIAAIITFGALAMLLSIAMDKLLKGAAQRAILLASILLSGFFFREGHK